MGEPSQPLVFSYGVGAGREGFGLSGVANIHSKQEWPDWYPPREMLQRQPELMKVMTKLQSGIGMRGGLPNPLGACQQRFEFVLIPAV